MERRLLTLGILLGLIAVLAGCGGLFPSDPVNRVLDKVVHDWAQAIQDGTWGKLEHLVMKDVAITIDGIPRPLMTPAQYAEFEMKQWSGKNNRIVHVDIHTRLGDFVDSAALIGILRAQYNEGNQFFEETAEIEFELAKSGSDWKIARIERTTVETRPLNSD